MISELQKYVQEAIHEHGQTEEQVRQVLLKAGWKRPVVDSILASALAPDELKKRQKPLPKGVSMTMKQVSEEEWNQLRRRRHYSMPIWIAFLIFFGLVAVTYLAVLKWGVMSWPQIASLVLAGTFLPIWILLLGGAERLEGTRAAEWLLPGLLGQGRQSQNPRMAMLLSDRQSYSHWTSSQIKRVAVGLLIFSVVGMYFFLQSAGGNWHAIRVSSSTNIMQYEQLPKRFYSFASCERWIKKEYSGQLTGSVGRFFCGSNCQRTEIGFIICEKQSRIITP